jgi:HPt (histidine-containing phosphotransfer) domain-containing protein
MPEDSDFDDETDALWRERRPGIEGRVDVVAQAAAAAAAGTLDAELRVHACQEAHKLAGVLGTFGRPAGSKAAQGAEAVLAGSADLDTVAAALTAALPTLRHAVAPDD